MPKVRPLTEEERTHDAFRRILGAKRELAGYKDWTALSDAMGISQQTFSARKRNPNRFNLDDLHRLFKFLKYTPDEIVESLGFKP